MRLNINAFSMCLVVAAMTGCAGLGTPKPDLQADFSKSTAAGSETANAAGIDVVFQPERGRPERLQLALTQPTTVQQVLVQTGGIKKYRRIQVELLRPLTNGGYHTIPCEYDRETRQIDPVNDYALMPGDRVIITEDTSTIIDDMMGTASGNLSKRFTTGGKHKAAGKYRIEG